MSLVDGTPEELKACARSTDFPTGRTWAQVDDGGKGYVDGVEGKQLTIVCFPLVEFRNPIGTQLVWHPTTVVTAYTMRGSSAKSYQVERKDYSTLEEAAATGCAESAAKMKATAN